MEIGLNGISHVDQMDEMEDFGIGWVKQSLEIKPAGEDEGRNPASRHEDIDIQVRHLSQQAEDLHGRGMRMVIDVRTDPRIFVERTPVHLKKLQAERAEEFKTATESRKHEIAVETARIATTTLADLLGEEIYYIVDQLKDVIKDWEWWGEHTCPIVSLGSLPQTDYTLLLGMFNHAVKQADPEARTWNGGDGVSSTTHWLNFLVNPPSPRIGQHTWYPGGVGEHFDVCNWHHYKITMGPGNEDYGLSEVIDRYDEVFAESRRLLKEYGTDQPFASTEWGITMVDDEVLDYLEALQRKKGQTVRRSYTYSPGWPALPENHSAEWFGACLDCFDGHGFEVLCIHEWQDKAGGPRDMNHWGAFCGLKDIGGNKRPCYYVVRDFARANYGTAFN